MATFNKFQGFVGYLGTGVIDLDGDTINAYLSNATPDAAADDVKADLAEITNENGYTAPEDSTNTYSETSGTGTLATTDITITASGGTIGPFRYVVHYDDTVSSPVVDPLMCWHDYGAALTLQDGDSFTINYGASLATLA